MTGEFNKPWEVPASNPPEEQPQISDAEVASATEVTRVEEPKELEGLAAVYAEDDIEKQKEKCLKEIGKVLEKHDGMESNISLKDEYWDLTALYRKLTANP